MKKIRICLYIIMLLALTFSFPTQAETFLQDEVYTGLTQSVTESWGDGTKEKPYNRFEDAVANVKDGGIIYILSGAAALINEQENGYAPYVLDKEVTICPEPGADQATLNNRAAGIILGADVTIENIELSFECKYRDHFFANGYALSLINTSRESGSRLIDLVAGSVYGTTGGWVAPNPGEHCKIVVQGDSSEFGNLYAGSINGGYTGDVTIVLKDMDYSDINAIYASGARDAEVDVDNWFDMTEAPYPEVDAMSYMVSGQVNVTLDDMLIRSVCGDGAEEGTVVTYNTTYLAAGETLDCISKLVVAEGEVRPSVLTAPMNQNIDLEIRSAGTLDLTQLGDSVTVDNFTGGGKLVLGEEGVLTVLGTAMGETSFETAGGSYGSSGMVIAGHTYIYMPTDSTATFTFVPDYFQKGWTFERSQEGDWSAVEGDNVWIYYYTDNGLYGVTDVDFEVLVPEDVAEGVTALPYEGYHFVKWTNLAGEQVGTEEFFVPQKVNGTYLEEDYIAHFAPNTYSVSFDANGGVGTMSNQMFTYGVEQMLTQNICIRDGYIFEGWNTQSDGTGTNYADQQRVSNLTTKQDGNIILYAQWISKDTSENVGDEETGDGAGNGNGEDMEGSTANGEEETEGGAGDSNGERPEDGSGVTESQPDNGSSGETENGSGGTQDSWQNAAFILSKLTDVKISKVTYNAVTLSWSARSGATCYQIYRSTKKSSGYKKLATVTGTTYTNKNLKMGKKYYYKVRAVSENNQSAFSDVVIGEPALLKPVLKVSKGKRSATVKYGKVKGADGYEIYRSTRKNKGFKKIKTTAKTSYKNSKLKSKKTYYYKVRAYRKVDGKKVYSSFSKVKAVKVK